MKEVTEWNGKPRMMWVWDDVADSKIQKYVVYILSDKEKEDCGTKYPVRCGVGMGYCHCAEIEEPQKVRMTNYDLAKWLADGARCGEFREMKSCNSMLIHSYYDYVESKANEPCYEDILIRSNCGEWRDPLKESEE